MRELSTNTNLQQNSNSALSKWVNDIKNLFILVRAKKQLDCFVINSRIIALPIIYTHIEHQGSSNLQYYLRDL